MAATSDPSQASAGNPCSPGTARCVDEVTSEVCNEEGKSFERTRCEVDTLCLEGRCVGLASPRGKLDPARFHTVRGEGWLNGWGATEPLSTKSFDKLPHPDAVLTGVDAPKLTSLCAARGFVTVLTKDKKRKGETRRAVLAGYLVSGQQRPVTVLVGMRGGARVYLNGAIALEGRRPGNEQPLQDEVIADAELRAGVNTLVVVVEQFEPAPAGLWLRVRGARGEPLPDLRFASAASEDCAPEELLDVRWSPRAIAEGFAVEAHLQAPGLWPRRLGELSYEARLTGKKGEGDVLGRGAVPLASLTGEGASVSMVAPFEEAGKAELRLRLEATGRGADATTPAGPSAKPGAASSGRDKLAEVRTPLVFRGDLHRSIIALDAAVTAAARPDLPSGSRDSFTHHVATLKLALAEAHPDLPWLRAHTREAKSLAKVLLQGQDPYRNKTGVVHRAYRAKVDGALQPYLVFVPPSYKSEGTPMPLVLVAHGLDNPPGVALRALIGEAPDMASDRARAARHLPAFPDQGAILAAPWGFGNAGPRPLGEQDTLDVIDAIEADYRVDPRRVSLTGYSLGGTVAFTVPLHYPDRFAAAAPLCGYPNLKDYRNVRGVPHAPWEDRLIDQRYIVRYAENGLHLPLHVVHGGKDGPDRSRVVVDRYRALGNPVTFDLQDDLDHNVWDHGYERGRMISWLTARRRPEVPPRVRLVTGEHRYDRAFWVRLVGREDGARRGEIDAHWVKDARRVEVTTRNVEALALDFRGIGTIDGGTAQVVLDGESPIEVSERAGEAFFVRRRGAWTRSDEAPPRAGKKRPGVSGPLDDALRHQQLIVYGTLDPAQTETNRAVAAYHGSIHATGAETRYPVKADTEITEAELTGRTLVLVGSPSSNRVTALFAGDLPVKFEDDALTLRGKRHAGPHVGVSLIWPHPRDAAEYLVLHAGVTFRGTAYSRFLPRLAPDFVVYDARITAQKGDLLMDRRPALDGGFFGEAWD
ncbi:alpha/beta hydrolase-fold protein [Chondromyces crocatus]|uniref:alpha/beta hydrolase-fold protein n=1 Tax=Chondromyces crocatus TaxID=52 RepID=UPI001C54D468|nr:alpha/beta hydrolase-fold protein [Chondromyces crocatus]